MKNVSQLILLFMFSMQVQAQEKTVSGIVSNENGMPLPGATIIVKGTTNGTSSNFDGEYTIQTKAGDVLTFAYVGYAMKSVKINKQTTINVSLEPDNSLEEVVVTTFGVKRSKREVSYQTPKVTSSQYLNKSNNRSRQGLTGKVAGLQINTKKSKANPSTQVLLRGLRSPSVNNPALIVIDGVVSTTEELSKLKPKKIKNVNVLKGANASALYGSRGGNGVIIVQTKNGNYKLPKHVKAAIDKSKHIKPQPVELANETYEEIVENDFEIVRASPLSTFSIDVDKAAYSNIRRLINNGNHVPANAVKIEEMVNYFSYDYPQPTNEHRFSINTDLVKTPWNSKTQLVKIGLQGKTYLNEDLPPSNLTFLIDVSGSMSSHNKLPLLKSTFKLLVNQLREKDKVAIVVYAGAAGVVLEPTSGANKEKIMSALNNLNAGGSTAGGVGIERAYKLAEKHFKTNGNNRVILATDGDFNVGASSDKAMEELIEEKRKSGVFLSVIGLGYGNYKDSKLEILADKGNGNHAYIDTMQEAQKVFGKEFGGTLYTIAKDVKIQVEFNPNKVQAYRLIGYENRMLDDEDFVDDTIDAGELGSGHTVTALYEVIPVGVKSDYLKEITDLKYTKPQVTQNYSDELLTVKFRYKMPDGQKSIEMVHILKDQVEELTADMQFASAVALFGMQIRGSKFHNDSKLEDVITLADAGRGVDKAGYRAEFIRLITTYQNL